MSIDREQLEDVLIIPTLLEMDHYLSGAYSKSAVNMLLGILAQESAMGTYLIQKGASVVTGAKGIYQIEGKTDIDVWDNFLEYNDSLADWIHTQTAQVWGTDFQLIYNLRYSTIMARLVSVLIAKLQSFESTKVGFAAVTRIVALLFFIVILGTWYDLLGLSFAVLLSSILETIFLSYLFFKKINN